MSKITDFQIIKKLGKYFTFISFYRFVFDLSING